MSHTHVDGGHGINLVCDDHDGQCFKGYELVILDISEP